MMKSELCGARGCVFWQCVDKITIVAPVVSENGAAVVKEVAAKRPHFMGRMLARSATFSVVDPNSKSVHAKAEYGRKLEKTLEFLASQGSVFFKLIYFVFRRFVST